MERNPLIDYGKGVLICLVTIGHAIQYAVYQGEGFWDNPLYQYIYMFHMPLFMAVSGYVSHAGIQREPYGQFVFNKLKTYGVPIVVWALLFRLAIALVRPPVSATGLLASIIHEANHGLWFLWALLGCLVITATIKATQWNFWLLGVGAFLGLLLLPERANLPMLKYMFPYFLTGYYCASIEGLAVRKRTYIWVFVGSFFLTAALYVIWRKEDYIYNSGMLLADGNSLPVAVRYLSGFVVSIFSALMIHQGYLRSSKWLQGVVTSLGRGSIYIYILQGYLFTLILQVAPRYFRPIASVPLGILIALALGLLVAFSCLWLGRAISSNQILAAVLFGRASRRSASAPASLAAIAR